MTSPDDKPELSWRESCLTCGCPKNPDSCPCGLCYPGDNCNCELVRGLRAELAKAKGGQ